MAFGEGAVLITEREIRESIRRVIDHAESIWDEWAWQVENRTWKVLGYESWDEMRRAEYGALTSITAPRAERPELVARFRGAGLTQQQTADTLGLSQRTVSNYDETRQEHPSRSSNSSTSGTGSTSASVGTVHADRQVFSSEHLEEPRSVESLSTLTDSAGRQQPARVEPTEPVLHDLYDVAAEFGVDMEGPDEDEDYVTDQVDLDNQTPLDPRPEPKADPAPAQPKQRRRPLPDQARDAGWELRKSVERLQRIAADDRFDTHKDAMAPQMRSHLTNAVEVCQDLLNRINNQEGA